MPEFLSYNKHTHTHTHTTLVNRVWRCEVMFPILQFIQYIQYSTIQCSTCTAVLRYNYALIHIPIVGVEKDRRGGAQKLVHGD